MKTWFNLFNLLALFTLFFVSDSLYRKLDLYEREYNAKRLICAVEYAAEKAFYDSIGTRSNQTDYISPIQVVVDPGKTLESFDVMMELNYGLSQSEASDVCIEDSIAGMSLITNDGYYLARLQKTGEDAMRLYWSPKYPYSYEKEEGGVVYTYGVTLADERWYRVWNKGGALRFAKGDSYGDAGAAGVLSDSLRRQIISRTLTDAVALSMEENVRSGQEIGYSLYIPSRQTLSGINAVSSPSFLVVMNSAPYAGCDETLDAAITGLKVIRKVRTVGYVDESGERKYCYETQQAGETCDIAEYFSSPEAAAKAGYTADYRFIFNKILYEEADY